MEIFIHVIAFILLAPLAVVIFLLEIWLIVGLISFLKDEFFSEGGEEQ